MLLLILPSFYIYGFCLSYVFYNVYDYGVCDDDLYGVWDDYSYPHDDGSCVYDALYCYCAWMLYQTDY
jgi:hypothetical protein